MPLCPAETVIAPAGNHVGDLEDARRDQLHGCVEIGIDGALERPAGV